MGYQTLDKIIIENLKGVVEAEKPPPVKPTGELT